jgi:hypothetical protein
LSKSKFKVYGSNKYNGKSEATVIIDRSNNLVMVKPKGMHRNYEMRLEDLAGIVIWNCIKSEIIEKRKAAKIKRKGL